MARDSGLGDGGGGGLGGSSGGEAANPVMGRAADTMVGRAAAADPVMGRVAAVDPGGDSRWRIRRASSGRGDDIDGRWQRHTAIVASSPRCHRGGAPPLAKAVVAHLRPPSSILHLVSLPSPLFLFLAAGLLACPPTHLAHHACL